MIKNYENKAAVRQKIKMNLQLFADEGTGATESGQASQEGSVNTAPTAEQTTSANSTPGNESTDNSSQQNYAWAKMRKENSDFKKEMESQKAKLDRMNKIISGQFGNQGVNDVDSYFNFLEKTKQQDLQRRATVGDGDAMQQLIDSKVKNSPEFKKFAEMETHYNDMIFNQKMQEEFNDFNQEFGQEISKYEDIEKMDNAQQILDYMQRGNTLTESYYLANRSSISSNDMQKAKQQAVNTMAGRGHMSKPASGSGDNHSVPKEVADQFRKMVPGATDEEIKRLYQKINS